MSQSPTGQLFCAVCRSFKQEHERWNDVHEPFWREPQMPAHVCIDKLYDSVGFRNMIKQLVLETCVEVIRDVVKENFNCSSK